MSNLIKSFFITFIIAMSVGIFLIFFMERNKANEKVEEVQVQNNVNKKVKREATKDDNLNILQVVILPNEKIFTIIQINPILSDVIVSNLSSDIMTDYNNKTLGELYDYGGIKLVVKTINKNLDQKIDRYLVIKNKDLLEDILDIVGSLEMEKEIQDFIKKFNIKCAGYYIIDSSCFLEIMNYRNYDILSKLIRQYYIQKIPIIDTQIGENMFKKVINKVNSDISFKDFCNLREINWDGLH